MNFRRLFLSVLLAAFLVTTAGVVSAEEVKEGAIITDENLAEMKQKTLGGHKIGDMITGPMEWMIKNKGFEMGLKKPEPVKKDKLWYEATEEHKGEVKFNPETKQVSGWKAGVPFPDVSVEDPNAAWKLMYNFFLGSPRGDYQDYPAFTFLFIDGDGGIERSQEWLFQRYFVTGRIRSRAPTDPAGDPNVRHKLLLFGRKPRNINGVGTFTIRYKNGRFDDRWAYIRTVRRTRRLTGGAWMDPIDGTDQLNSDIEVFSAHPTWYKDFKLVKKRWVLGIAHSPWPTWNRGANNPSQEYPTMNVTKEPYWYPDPHVVKFEPRPVYEIVAQTPKEHPYSKKVMYLDAKNWVFTHGEAYDQRGEFWKMILFGVQSRPTKDGGHALVSSMGHIIDFKKQHGTVFLHSKLNGFNTPGVTATDISLGQLKQGEPAGN